MELQHRKLCSVARRMCGVVVDMLQTSSVVIVMCLSAVDVGVHPGTNYSPDGTNGQNYLRLCFGYNSSEEINTGISLLTEFLTKEGALD